MWQKNRENKTATVGYINSEEKPRISLIEAYTEDRFGFPMFKLTLEFPIYPDNEDEIIKKIKLLKNTYNKRLENIKQDPQKYTMLDVHSRIAQKPSSMKKAKEDTPFLITQIVNNGFPGINRRYRVQLNCYNKRFAGELLYIVNGMFNLTSIINDLFSNFQIKPFFHSLEAIKAFIDNKHYEQALQLAKEAQQWSGNENFIYQLGQYTQEKGVVDFAYEIYKQILPDNLFYRQANLDIYHIICSQKTAIDQGIAEPLNEEEQQQMLLEEVNALLKIPTADQEMIDQRIHQLCGVYNLDPEIKNVRCDSKTILALCNCIKKLREEAQFLKEKTKNTVNHVGFGLFPQAKETSKRKIILSKSSFVK
jgi:hypothetical protein